MKNYIIIFFVMVLAVLISWVVRSDGFDNDALAGWDKGKLFKAEEEYYCNRIRRIVGIWRKTTQRNRNKKTGRVKQPNDVILVIDLSKPALWMEYKGQVVEALYTKLPDNMNWGIHQSTPDGNKRLAELVRFKLRGVQDSNFYPEMIYLAGNGRGRHLRFKFKNGMRGTTRGGGAKPAIPKYSGQTPKHGVDVYKSLIVDDQEYSKYLAGLKERKAEIIDGRLAEKFFEGKEKLWKKFMRWQAVEKRMYAEMNRQVERAGYRPYHFNVKSGPGYLAGHAEIRGDNDSFFGRGSANVTLQYEYLGEGIWYVVSVPGRWNQSGPRTVVLGMEFLVSEDGKFEGVDKDKWLEKGRKAKAEAEIKPSKWRAKLDNGVEVEFIGLCENPSGEKTWFGPDGSEIGKFPVSNYERFSTSKKRNIYEFAWRVHWPDPKRRGGTRTSVEGSRGSYRYHRSIRDKYGFRSNDNLQLQGMSIKGYSFKKDRQKTTLRLAYRIGKAGKSGYSYVRFENVSLFRGKDMGFKIVVEEDEK